MAFFPTADDIIMEGEDTMMGPPSIDGGFGPGDARMSSVAGDMVSPSSASTARSIASFSTPYRSAGSGVSPEALHSNNVTPDSQQANAAAAQSAQDQKRTRACESCRSLKVRCEPDVANPEGSCRRCAKARRECIFTVPTRKRQKRTDSRVAELERKIDKLTATLNARRRGENDTHDISESEGSADEPIYRSQRHTHRAGSDDRAAGDSDQFRESEPKRQRLMSQDGVGVSRRSSGHGMEDVSNESMPMFGGRGSRVEYSSSASAPPKSQFAVPRHAKHVHSSMPTPETDPGSNTSPAQGHGPVELDVIDRKIISMEMATKMFNHYNEKLAPHFPAVTFPRGTTAAELRRSKPFLFLAILAAASAIFDPDQNRVLNKEVIRGIADRVVVNGEKSLEIIQVLIVATLWYYPPEQFEELKFYQLTHMAAVMAIDCGLNKPHRHGRNRIPWMGGVGGAECSNLNRMTMLNNQPPSSSAESTSSTGSGRGGGMASIGGWKKSWLPDPSTLEAKRTFISCYWMCSNVAMSLRRPNLLRYSAYMGECVEFIENCPEATNDDKIICQWVKLQRITEEVGIAFGYEDSVAKVNLAETRIQFALKGFERQLEEWEKNLPNECMTKTVKLANHTLSLFMHEVALHGDHSTEDFRPPYLEEKLIRKPDAPPHGISAQLTQSHINALFSCLSAAHGLLDGFLSFSVDELRCVPVLFFARVAYAIVLLIKIFFSASAAKSEVGKVIDKPQLKLDHYFEKLLGLLKAASAEDKSKPAGKFLMILTMLSHWYQYQQRASNKTGSGRRQSTVVPASPSVRGEMFRGQSVGAFPMSPGMGFRQVGDTASVHIHTPHSTGGRETPQPPSSADTLGPENPQTPLQLLSDVATTADEPGQTGNNMMNIDGGNFGLPSGDDGMAGGAFNPNDDSWLTNPLDMGVFGMGDFGGFESLSFPGFSDPLGGDIFGDQTNNNNSNGNTGGFFDWTG